jgi:hypothetical protein
VFAYTSEPPPTPAPESTNTSEKKESRRMPKHLSAGIQRARRMSQLVLGKSRGEALAALEHGTE